MRDGCACGGEHTNVDGNGGHAVSCPANPHVQAHVRAGRELHDKLVDHLLALGDRFRHELARTPRWRWIHRHTLTNKIIGVAFELQSIEQNIIRVDGHVKEHMRTMGIVE